MRGSEWRCQPVVIRSPTEPILKSFHQWSMVRATVEYGPGDEVRQVNPNGQISFRSRRFKVGKAFGGHPVALRPTTTEGEWEVYFCHQKIRTLNLEDPVR